MSAEVDQSEPLNELTTGLGCYHYIVSQNAGDYKESQLSGVRGVLVGLSDNTTTHGYPFLSKARGRIKNVFWMLCILATSMALLYSIARMANRYLDRQVRTSISVNEERRLIFPAVTICNLSPVRKTALEQANIKLDRKRRRKKRSASGITVNNNTIPFTFDCVLSLTSREYIGPLNVTQGGIPCQPWTRNTPQNHAYTAATSISFPGDGSARNAGNKCRNPDLNWLGPPWCYTMNTSIRWDNCFVPKCECKLSWDVPGTNYLGSRSTTLSGRLCQRWDSSSPHQQPFGVSQYFLDANVSYASNYCRNPNSTRPNGPWCFTTDPNVEWEYCSVPICDALTTVAARTTSIVDTTAAVVSSQTSTDDRTTSVSSDVSTLQLDAATINVSMTTTASAGTTTDTLLSQTKEKHEQTPLDSALALTTEQPDITDKQSPTYLDVPTEDTAQLHNIHCCCHCCSSIHDPCIQCDKPSLTDALSCATVYQEPTLTPVQSVTPKFQAPNHMAGSQFPERLALTNNFMEKQELTETLTSLPTMTKIELGFQQRDMIVDCTYDGEPCSKTDFTIFNNPTLGNCYIFNSGWNTSQPLKWSTRRTQTSRRSKGLSLVINIQQYEYVNQVGSTAGIVVLPLEQYIMPVPEDHGYLVGPGYKTSIGITKKSIKRLSRPYSGCTDDDTNRNSFIEYSIGTRNVTQACLKTCYLQLVIETCGCSDPYTLVNTNNTVPVCVTMDMKRSDCQYNVTMNWGSHLSSCSCPDRCNEVLFHSQLTQSKWPSILNREILKQKLKSKLLPRFVLDDRAMFEKNMLKLDVFYQDFKQHTITQSPAYSGIQFMIDFGGVTGLWLGFAVLTFFEWFELATDLLVYSVHQLYKRRRDQNRLD